jgi:hypothetical protein
VVLFRLMARALCDVNAARGDNLLQAAVKSKADAAHIVFIKSPLPGARRT